MKQFKTESKKLLDLMINSIYTNREIFLRELISNASDAIDKLSFASLTDPDLKVDQASLAIRLSFDRDARTITVSDNGIGMTQEELDRNLGTIAHSGSEQFKEANAERQGEDVDIIGQFGVGFYSAFMVADRVRVVSRALGSDEASAWESDGVKGYTIGQAAAGERDGADDHGTDVVLYLRESTDEENTDRFLSEWGLKELVRRYSNYVRHPIQMMVTKSRELPKPEDAGDDYKPQYEDYEELETINSMTPIWKKRASEVEQKDYNEFYQSTFHDYLLALLPTATASIFEPTLVPMTLIAEAPVLWLPLIAWVGTLGIILSALLSRPRIPRSCPPEELTSLVRTHGGGTLGWMSTWEGNLVWLSPTGDAGGAYRGSGGVALTVADLAYAPGKASAAITQFSEFALASGLTPALYSIHEELAQAAKDAGWTIMQVAEESVLDLPDLAFRGKAYQDVRTAMNHAKREGVEAVWTTWDECPEGWKDQITVISDAWSADKALPEMGFTLGGVRELSVPETRILVAIDSDHTIHAVTSWLPIYRDGQVIGLTLDVMRRRAEGWRPAIEFLIGKAALSAQEEGLSILSLSGAPLARSEDDTSAFGPLIDALASIMEPLYGFSSLHAFKRKFKPRTQSLYLAVPDPTSLATVGLAIAHAYVPSVRPAQTLALVASVAGGLAKRAARGVGDLRSSRGIGHQDAPTSHPGAGRDVEGSQPSSNNGKKDQQ